VTHLLVAWRNGEADAPRRLFPIVYKELRLMARHRLGRRRRDQTLDTAALVHEAYLKLADHSRLDLADRRHFFALTGRVMRQIVVDEARRRVSQKRGGSQALASLDEVDLPLMDRPAELLSLDSALEQLARRDRYLARIVELRFFAGLSVEDVAEALDSSPRSVKREWRKARAFLLRELMDGGRG
jgi:RNA polymerase sigma factor (TIGR02999 family)